MTNVINEPWRVDTTQWPPLVPGQRDWESERIIEGSTGKAAALLYGVLEVRMNYYVGRLAILSGDPRHPQVLFRRADFACEEHGVQWHADDRFLSVHVPMSRRRFW